MQNPFRLFYRGGHIGPPYAHYKLRRIIFKIER